jgi:hypothetical protein
MCVFVCVGVYVFICVYVYMSVYVCVCVYVYVKLVAKLQLFVFIFSGTAAQHGLWPPRPRCFLITHNDAPQSVGLLWTGDQLVAETST